MNETPPAAVTVATPTKQAGEATPPRERWGWVERCVWTARRLTRLTSGEPADRVWFSLLDKTHSPANSQSALMKVCCNGGGGGADRQTVAHFERHAEAELQRLHEQLRAGKYRPQPVRRAWIAKPGSNERRPLGIPAVRDRIVQGALRRVDTLLKAGHPRVVDADLKSCFDSIPHERLLALVKQRVADGRVLALVASFLCAGVLEEAKGWQPTQCGTPQGGVISPLRANVYLHPLDHHMAQAGWAMVRYADDFVILCRSEAEAQAALAAGQAWVSEAGLTLHPEKPRIEDATQRVGFDFLGYHVVRGRKWPRAKSLKTLRERLRQETPRLSGRSLAAIVTDVSRSLRGWYGYVQHSQASTFATVEG